MIDQLISILGKGEYSGVLFGIVIIGALWPFLKSTIESERNRSQELTTVFLKALEKRDEVNEKMVHTLIEGLAQIRGDIAVVLVEVKKRD